MLINRNKKKFLCHFGEPQIIGWWFVLSGRSEDSHEGRKNLPNRMNVVSPSVGPQSTCPTKNQKQDWDAAVADED